jgi:RimJ/RimL family protein N-acetyltransferase
MQNGDVETAAGWLADPRNVQWLDFGAAVDVPTALTLKLWSQRKSHSIWVFGPAEPWTPVGLVGLGNIHPRYRTAEAWCVLGDKRFGTRDLTAPASAQVIGHGFAELGLRSIYAWTVEVNRGGRRLLERLGFRFIGRQRSSHTIDGGTYDRLWFDLLPQEFRGLEETWR